MDGRSHQVDTTERRVPRTQEDGTDGCHGGGGLNRAIKVFCQLAKPQRSCRSARTSIAFEPDLLPARTSWQTVTFGTRCVLLKEKAREGRGPLRPSGRTKE